MSPALAASPPAAPTTEEAFLAEIPVARTASRLGQTPSDSPNAVAIIDRELIRATGAREIPELLRLVPGMYVSYVAYVRGLQPIVAYHGLPNEVTNRMQVLVDGRAVYNPTVGEVSWSDLPLAIADIERIEVVRGPSAASHGANSFLGVINIITRHAAQERGVYAALTRGTRSVDDGFVRFGSSAGNLDYRITAGYRSDDMYAGIADNRRINLLTFRGDYRLGNRDMVTLQAGYNGGHRDTQSPASEQPDPVDHPRTFTTKNHFEQLRWVRALDRGELSLQLFHNHLGVSDVVTTEPIALLGNQQFVLDDSVRADRYDIELQHTIVAGPALRWVWGASWRYDFSDAPLSTVTPVGNHSQRLFAHAEWHVAPRWLVNAGAMLERTELTDPELSPRFAVNYRLTPQQTLRASISRALRNPTLFEEKADRRLQLGPVFDQRFLSSGMLQPERILSRELGYVLELPRHGLSFDAKLFNDRITGLIGEVLVPFPAGLEGVTRDFANLNDVRQTGFETQLRWRASRATRLGLAQSHVATHSNDVTALYSASTPRNTYSAFLIQQLTPRTSATVMAFHQDKAQPTGFGQLQDAYNRLDLRLAARFGPPRAGAVVALVIQDLFNDHYTDFRHDNVFDRRAYVTLEVSF